MKFRATFKTPDVLRDAAGEEAAFEASRRLEENNALDQDHWELTHELWDELLKFAKKWVRYGELVTIEFDTEAGTATVVPL